MKNRAVVHGAGDEVELQRLLDKLGGEVVVVDRLDADKGMVLELRSEGVQDIFPPSVHPSGSSYRWIRAPWDVDDLPDPPPLLLDLWTNWDKSLPSLMETVDPHGFKKELETTAAEYRHRATEDTDWDKIREQIRQQITPAELLSRHGIYPVRPNGYLCPFHQESRASF